MLNLIINSFAIIGLITFLIVLYFLIDIPYQYWKGRETVRELTKLEDLDQQAG